MRITHVGDNFPGLQSRVREQDSLVNRLLVTNPNYLVSAVGIYLDLGDVDYLRVNSHDMKDAQIMFTGKRIFQLHLVKITYFAFI